MYVTHSTKVDRLTLLYGSPIQYKDICLIHAPTMADIAELGTEIFYMYMQIMTLTPRKKPGSQETVSPLILFIAQTIDPEMGNDAKRALTFFVRETPIILPDIGVLAFGGENDSDYRIITPEDFIEIQEIIRKVCYLSFFEPQIDEKSPHAKRIAEDLARSKATVAEVKGRQAGSSDIRLPDLVSSLSILTPGLDVWALSYYAFNDILHRAQVREEYLHNVQAAMAGAKIPKAKLKHWIRPVEKE